MSEVPATQPSSASTELPELSGRYRFLAELDRGGMGVVLRVEDTLLRVPVALKVLHPHLAADPACVARFWDEARLLASIRHPGAPAAHDLGTLDCGWPYYTMEEVPGGPLRDVLRVGNLTRRRLLELVARVAATMEHAHGIGIVHRDLSANNVLVGPRGEPRIVDWGLARRVGDPPDNEATGTSGYAAPEQRAGSPPDPRMDVYALGGLLGYVLSGTPPHLPTPLPIVDDDPELASLYARCRADDPAHRPADAGAVARELQSWLDGVVRQDRARAALALAERHAAAAAEHRRAAAQMQLQAAQLLGGLPADAPEAAKASGWALEDEAERAIAAAERERVLFQQRLLVAVREEPTLDRPHEMLVADWLERLVDAERTGDGRQRAQYDTLVRSWRDGRYAAWADAPAKLSVDSEPSGAEVAIERYVSVGRRLQPEPVAVGRAPLALDLPAGSYRLTLRAAGHHEVTLPVVLRRGEPWTPQGPRREPCAVWLPPLGAVRPGERYVAPGWTWLGGDPLATDGLPRRRVFVHGFAIGEHPVTVAAYVAFLDALRASDGPDAAWERVPRESEGVHTEGRPVFLLEDGRFVIRGDRFHDRWHPDWPVTLVDWFDARAYARSVGGRLPHDLEWEKAARGADERVYAMGATELQPAWANLVTSRAGSPLPAAVDAFPIDVSPYGIRGTVGNVRDWCGNVYARAGDPGPVLDVDALDRDAPPPAGAVLAVRGGAWSSTPMLSRAATRFAGTADHRLTSLGFRVARTVRRP